MVLAVPRFALAQDAAGAITLTLEKSTMPIVGRGGKTPVWRFNKSAPITVVRAKQGIEIKGRIINLLDQELWLHWFGVRGASSQMVLNVLPGAGNAVDFFFTPPDAGTFWFGPMTHASQQRDMGLYGMLIVEEATPLQPLLEDVPLIFDDWLLDDMGRPKGKFGELDAAIGEGRLGDWFTVNGSFKSRIKINRAKPTRLRILNAANARAMNLLFKGATPWVMALDGQPVTLKALEADRLQLMPGQRADLLLTAMSAEAAIALEVLNDVTDVLFLQAEGPEAPDQVPDNFKLPPNPVSELGDLATARHIAIEIQGGAKGGLKSAKVGADELDLRGLLEKGLAWAFNGIAGVGGPPLFEAVLGDTVVLDITNKTSFPQPIHVHGNVWKLIESDGQVIDASGWRDTTIVPGLSTVKLAMVTDNPGLWVLQSLIAERVDAGLIAAFSVKTMN